MSKRMLLCVGEKIEIVGYFQRERVRGGGEEAHSGQ